MKNIYSNNEIGVIQPKQILDTKNKKCIICLDEKDKSLFSTIWKCKHSFHTTCINHWLNISLSITCPLCRCDDIIIFNHPELNIHTNILDFCSETYIDNMQGNGAMDITYYKYKMKYTYNCINNTKYSKNFEKAVIDLIIRNWKYIYCFNRNNPINEHHININIPRNIINCICSCGSVQCFTFDDYVLNYI